MKRTASVLFLVLTAAGACADSEQPADGAVADTSASAAAQHAAQPASGPVFEVAISPGEGIPVVESVVQELLLLRAPADDAPVVAVLRTSPGATLTYDSTRYQTLQPATVRATQNALITGRNFGAITYLSRDDYYGRAGRADSIQVAAGAVIELLQHRAEGTCFIRIDGDVIDARPCPTLSTAAFEAAAEPVTALWIRVRQPGGNGGWLQLSDSTAHVVRRTF